MDNNTSVNHDDILFCTTDSNDFYRQADDVTKNYQVSALVECKPWIFGLQAWEELKDEIDFNRFKLIWLHLNPRVMDPPWYMFTALFKRVAPDPILFLKHEYWEKYFYESMPYVIKHYSNYADYVGTNTLVGKKILEDNLNVPVKYHHVGQPRREELDWLEPLPWKDRHGIFVLRHTSRDSMVRKVEVGKRTGLPVTVVDSEPFTDGSLCKMLGEAYDTEVYSYPRLEWEEYMDKMRQCRVAVEIDYVGICRMSYEAGRVGVPVIGTNLAEYRNLIYPDLTTGPDDIDLICKLVKKYHSREPKTILRRATKYITEYWSKEACRKRLFKLFEEIGYGKPKN